MIYPCLAKYDNNTEVQHYVYNNSNLLSNNNIIRVKFGLKEEAWAYVGKQAHDKHPSIYLGFFDPPLDFFYFENKKYIIDDKNYIRNGANSDVYISGATIRHEFCHVLGLLHEHQNTTREFKLNIPEILKYYKERGLSNEVAYHNVINKYTGKKIVNSEIDLDSIMLYSLPNEWVDGDNPTKFNSVLSDLDKKTLLKMYPKNAKNKPSIIFIAEYDENCYRDWIWPFFKKIITEDFSFLGINYIF
jgi:hypothetical protein